MFPAENMCCVGNNQTKENNSEFSSPTVGKANIMSPNERSTSLNIHLKNLDLTEYLLCKYSISCKLKSNENFTLRHFRSKQV